MIRRTLLLSLLVLCFLTMPTLAQDVRWDGADELDVNPLACPGEDETSALSTAPGNYNGGLAMAAPERAGKDIILVDIPRQIGTTYFKATSRGVQEAAQELGNVEVVTDAPAYDNSDEQITFIEYYIDRGIDGILISATDGTAIAPTLQQAMEAGIHVVGYDSNTIADAREWFVYPAPFNSVVKIMADTLADEQGPDAGFAIVTSAWTTPTEARWIAELWAYVSACYPQMTWLETVEAQDDAIVAYNQATTLIDTHGADLNGLLGMTSVITPNLADAVTQVGLCGEVSVIGLAMPNDMKPFVDGGCVQSAILWNPIDLGYAAVYVMRAMVDGELVPGETTIEAGRLGELTVIDGSTILLGEPLIFDADNINNEAYDF